MAEKKIMPLPYMADVGDRLDGEGGCWVIDCEQGSVAEIQCPSDVAEATALFIVKAANTYKALSTALVEANQLIRLWHGEEAWDIYEKHSPEMRRINSALALLADTQQGSDGVNP